VIIESPEIIEPTEKMDTLSTEPEEEQYIPDLMMTSSHDFRTFWKETFNVDVQAFDGNINSNPVSSSFLGRINGVDVKVLLSLDNVQIATLSGVTANNGHWDGEYYFKENISAPGEYVVDVILSYLGETVSKSSSMFVVASTTGGDITNHRPTASAGSDQTQPEHDGGGHPGGTTVITLDGSGSSDSDGDAITFSWVQTSGTPVTLSDDTIALPTFTAPNITVTEDLIFQLTVTDVPLIGTAKSSTDSVTITITFVD